MSDGHLWERFFNEHAPNYMENRFTRNTVAEVDFLIKEMPLAAGCSVLDIGCGTGRHAVELAARDRSVTGLDLSEGMLNEARKAARQSGVSVEWVHGDAAAFSMPQPFDAAICLCEGAFGLFTMEDIPDEKSMAILGNIRDALKPGAPFLMTTLNGYRTIRKVNQSDVASGRFDPVTMTELVDDESIRQQYKERRYTPPELALMLRFCGFGVDHIWGGTAGSWGRRDVALDEVEFMVLCHKA
ncbi:class I SAM-dependent methyltransferase [Paenibacillus piri]|uniref:Class I SAM-dependent methyltransferase n=1 Tax=Paenibacillus piri TaxID=2547395 RepID=A0A4R5KFL8_9BACL|nr:class I SAM-dependent methyltransferase [Paenibacillus piri]TDF94076.1 class I SAM-dependent methyltransferase [Paenibacillus piri]